MGGTTLRLHSATRSIIGRVEGMLEKTMMTDSQNGPRVAPISSAAPTGRGQERAFTPVSDTTVTFTRPFMLSSIHGPQPPGTYRVDTEDEEVVGPTFFPSRAASRD